MAKIDIVSTQISAYSDLWMGTIQIHADEYKDHMYVKARFYCAQKYSTSAISGSFSGSITINGEKESFTFNKIPYLSADYRSTYETAEHEIFFDENGEIPVTVQVSLKGAPGTVFSGYTLGGMLPHTYTNAATPGALSMSPSAKQMGDTAVLAISPGTGAVTHSLYYSFGGVTKGIASFYNSEYQYEWMIPDLAAECPNETSGILTLTLKTYRFGTLVGSDSVSREISVPPASELTVEDMAVGETTSISIGRKSANFTSTVRYSLLQQEGTVAEGIAEDAYEWNIPVEVAKRMPNTKEETIYLYCDTYNGTALVGTTSARATIRVNTDDARFFPVIDSVTVEGNVPGASEAFRQMILQNVSGVAVTVEAHSEVSEIAGYEIAVFGDSFSEPDGTFDIVANSFAGTHTMTVRVTDTRGASAETTKELKILPYIKPKVVPYSVGDVQYSAPICYRSDREGIASGSGTFMRILAGKMCTEVLQDGANINASKLEKH